MRATLEVVGGNNPRTSTSNSVAGSSLGMRSKITSRHHGAAVKPVGYSANLLGTSGVPMRLSASEVGDEENSEDDAHSGFHGQRTGSGRSSLRNSARLSAYNQRQPGRLSTGSTPPNGQGSSPAEVAQDNETPVAGTFPQSGAPAEDYFQHPPGNGGSGSSGESESKFGNVGDMEAPKAANEGKGADDLSRRGSVDERASTIRHGAVRLFVANPDLSD